MGPRGIVFGPDKNLYVVSQTNNEVLRYDRNTGLPLGIFALPGSNPQNDLNSPTSLVFSPVDGNLLVTSFTPGVGATVPDKSEILRYNGATGVFISSFLAPPLGRAGPADGHPVPRQPGDAGPGDPRRQREDEHDPSVRREHGRLPRHVGAGRQRQPARPDRVHDRARPDRSSSPAAAPTRSSTTARTGTFLASITPEPLNAPDGFGARPRRLPLRRQPRHRQRGPLRLEVGQVPGQLRRLGLGRPERALGAGVHARRQVPARGQLVQLVDPEVLGRQTAASRASSSLSTNGGQRRPGRPPGARLPQRQPVRHQHEVVHDHRHERRPRLRGVQRHRAGVQRHDRPVHQGLHARAALRARSRP